MSSCRRTLKMKTGGLTKNSDTRVSDSTQATHVSSRQLSLSNIIIEDMEPSLRPGSIEKCTKKEEKPHPLQNMEL
jgi:hypothetical protein